MLLIIIFIEIKFRSFLIIHVQKYVKEKSVKRLINQQTSIIKMSVLKNK